MISCEPSSNYKKASNVKNTFQFHLKSQECPTRVKGYHYLGFTLSNLDSFLNFLNFKGCPNSLRLNYKGIFGCDLIK